MQTKKAETKDEPNWLCNLPKKGDLKDGVLIWGKVIANCKRAYNHE